MRDRPGAITHPSAAFLVLPWLLGFVLAWPAFNEARAQSLSDATATTESSCNFGMAKNQAKGSCEVPMLAGCVVANFPGTTRPWSNLSKGGNTSCRFDEKATDWKTKITGSCGMCKTPQCTARFGVMFDCSSNMPPPITRQSPPRPKP
ncbi:MAG: hypothetical protein KGL03_07275 [Nitrospirota bacterium]|nr:hypothetical protein [Nitrospirota bacterium]MDE3118801.1 hypothetical protein [Nitrospirota bacterium]